MAVRASLVGLSRRAFSTMIPENEMRRKLSHSTFIGISRRNFSTQKTQASSEMFNLNIVSNVVGEEPKLKKKTGPVAVGPSSEFVGVTWVGVVKKYRSTLRVNKKQFYNGYYNSEHDAAWAVNLMCEDNGIPHKNPVQEPSGFVLAGRSRKQRDKLGGAAKLNLDGDDKSATRCLSRRLKGEVMGPLPPPMRTKAPPPFKLSLEICQQAATEAGGECLSTSYKDIRTKMRWRCAKGHEWFANFTNIRHQNEWCPYCNGGNTWTIEDCQKLAESRGGECLSKTYWNSSSKLNWRCREGHEFQATRNQVQNVNNWCPICATSLNLASAMDAAGKRGWTCISPEWKGTKETMRWRCGKGHEFEASYTDVKKGHVWCYQCNPEKSAVLMRARLEAVMRGGRCMSIVPEDKLTFICANQHKFKAHLEDAMENWCPGCNDGEAGRSRRGKIVPMHLRGIADD